MGPWAAELDGADVVINLAGRSVNCRYTDANMKEMMSSRVDSTRAVGLAIARAARPPRVWLQMSTATIYAHRFDAANDEATGLIGGDEPDVPAYWRFSIDIAKAWEQAQAEAATPATRKVAMRTTMVMSPDRGGVFDVLLGLTRRGLGGTHRGRAAVDVVDPRARFRPRGLAADRTRGHQRAREPRRATARCPSAISWRRCARRGDGGSACRRPDGWRRSARSSCAPTPSWCSRAAASSPDACCDAGFAFEFPEWPAAAADLVARWRESGGRRGPTSVS